MKDREVHGNVPSLNAQLSCVIWRTCGDGEIFYGDELRAFLFLVLEILANYLIILL